MIGAANSPMSMFNPGGGDAFSRGMMIGNANSPFSSVAEALKNTVDRYHQHLDMQQTQQDKVDLLKQEYALKQQAASTTPDPDSSGPFTQVDPKTGKSFIRSTSIDATGRPRVSWAPVSINAPEDPVKTIEGLTLGPMIDQMRAEAGQSQATSPIPGVPPMSVIQPSAQAAVPSVNAQPKIPNYNPSTQKLQQNAKTGEYRVVSR